MNHAPEGTQPSDEKSTVWDDKGNGTWKQVQTSQFNSKRLYFRWKHRLTIPSHLLYSMFLTVLAFLDHWRCSEVYLQEEDTHTEKGRWREMKLEEGWSRSALRWLGHTNDWDWTQLGARSRSRSHATLFVGVGMVVLRQVCIELRHYINKKWLNPNTSA